MKDIYCVGLEKKLCKKIFISLYILSKEKISSKILLI